MAPEKLYFWIHCIALWNVLEIKADQCQDQLGMEHNLISDDAITASSTFADSVAPQNARIRQEEKGGAWCPKQLVDKDSYEYLQIDLDKLMVITKVEVQGRFGNGQGREYAETFFLDYQRQDGGKWIRFKNTFGREEFKGNTNTYSADMRDVSPPIIGKRIRFVPFSLRTRIVCMRVEMYGCEWTGQCLVPVINNATVVGLQELVYVNHDTEVQYQCNSGYVPRDSSNMRCYNGTWSSSVECVPDLPSQPEITGYKTGQVLRENDIVQLMCISKGGNPLTQIVWVRNNVPVDFSYIQSGNRSENELIITAQRSDNDAEYRCEAWNKVNADQRLVVTRKLLVFFAPKTATITGTREAKAGETLTLTCVTSNSNPAAVVEWISPGSRRANIRSRVEDSPNGGFITISEIDITLTYTQTNSIYTCSASNHQLGITVADTATVSVLYPPEAPRITGYSDGMPIRAGDLVKLTCSALGGNAPATLKWFKGDQELTEVNDLSAGNISSIEITIVARADDNGAIYKCEASNKATDSPLVALRKLTVHRQCQVPLITNATFVGLQELVYVNHNTEVKYQCNSGYVPRDSSTMKCENGTWSGSVECVQETDCGSPGPFFNGYVIGHRTTVGSVIFFSCNTRTTFEGDSIQSQCLDTGEWSNKPPTCWGQCLVPFIPSATVVGLRELVYVNHDTEVQYQCNSGLVPRDSSNMKCYNGTWSSSVECVPDQSQDPLGMENNLISDDAITTSSIYDYSVGPQNARIRQETNGGAWCPNQLVDKDSYEYLQIDLGKLTVITQVEVQGRFGNGQGQEWTETFLLEYQRQDGGKWIRFKNKLGQEELEGNENTYVAAMRDVSPPIIGKRIRFVPFSHHPRLVCMRVEMYGCEWTAVASEDISELQDSSQKHVENDVRLPSGNATDESNMKYEDVSSTNGSDSVQQGETPDSSEGDVLETVSDKENCSSQKIQLEFNQEIEDGLKMLAQIGDNRVQELVNTLITKIHHRNELIRTEDSSPSV